MSTLSWTEEQYRAYAQKVPQRGGATNAMSASPRLSPTESAAPKPSKMRNKPTTVDGIRFDSQLEAARYTELKLLVKAGDIFAFCLQVPFILPGGVKYVADFVVLQKDGTFRVEDAKGYRTPEYKNKRKQMRECLGIEIVEV